MLNLEKPRVGGLIAARCAPQLHTAAKSEISGGYVKRTPPNTLAASRTVVVERLRAL
jgi:hypothetical protein